MKFALSEFGEKLCTRSGILELMDDLGQAMTDRPDMIMMGGGNPARIPEVQAIWRDRVRDLLGGDQADEFDRMLVNYDPPQGNPGFIRALCDCLNEHVDSSIRPENIAITNGGQSAFFFLFNMLAGNVGGRRKRILLPLAPEYIGYANQGLAEDLFVTRKPIIEEDDGGHTFKYHVDFENLKVTDDIAAICVSRPTNPSGNVLTDDEIARLSDLAREHSIPLIVDNAYGAPFPRAIFGEVSPFWNDGVILTLSLSKLGLPGTRTGVVVAHEEIISAISAMTAVVGLSNNNVGQGIARPLIENGEIIRVSRDVIRPFYEERSQRAQAMVHEAMGDRSDFPWAYHRSEGAFFLWLSFRDLPVSTRKLYERLKERNVLVVPGEYFFFGLSDDDWKHRHECIRMTFTMPEKAVREGIGIIADEVRRLHAEAG